MLNRERLIRAFTLLGADLARRDILIEIAIYGGSALMLRFAWRSGTEDVDAVVRPGYDEALLASSVDHVAEVMGLAPDWLNDAVGMFTPLDEPDALFDLSGAYPSERSPGLRVLTASPRYLLAMKLKALASLDRGDRDLSDAWRLADHLGLRDTEALRAVYASIFDEEPPRDALRRFPAVLGP